ncbi:hypothetical protein [Pseudarthrobacter sp. NS4]|uniref:hypothetical protein n=1 Tax=Pseudarthrobacter sp. NS4 TaxID=2973976 RepID=UPI002161894A|nr:hypothetical protein [Pseudarthrobacter sp. NS4]
MKPSPLRMWLTAVLGACLGVSLLAGCSPAPDLDGAVAGQLQTRVAAAKQLAAAQDFPGALAELEQLNQDVSAAADQGKVSQQRKTRIEAAISTIRNDLETALAPAPQPVPTTPGADPPLTEDEKERAEEAQKEARKQREEAQKEADKLLEEAEKEAEKQQEEAEEQQKD